MSHLLHTLHTSYYYSPSASPAQSTTTLVRRSGNNTGASTAILFICLAVIGVLIALGIWLGAKKAQLRSRKQRPDAARYRSRNGNKGISRSQKKGRASIDDASSDDVEKGLNGSTGGYGPQGADGFEMLTPAPSYYSRSQRSGRDGRGIRAPGPRYGYAMPASFQGSVGSGPSDYSRRGAASDGRRFDVVPI
ncbi:hypothetical protein KC343_g8492 [Hortaea werneckii]|nr:hypothetical protein KC323_g2622 [Hortaea werneckii]KAI6871646.1 hypothetical protein KC338_g2464 [Hortaea werneckii]KAI7200432.1 hypothetical protein KC352_g19677 [Hortaea werneckii]KAI7356153.1 hypothetical protein KC320_g2365 [Hortaea werneckii]KAI7561866.1 hypothetical protein KC317_g8793 [Hortaea werneckii]